MTEQEIESLKSILNENEVQMIKIADVASQDELAKDFVGLDLKKLQDNDIRFLVRLSIVPKIEEGKVVFLFNDIVMKNEVLMRALPPVDLLIAVNSSYPSQSPPMFAQVTSFYKKWQTRMEKFLIDQLNEKWSEEMPVLYEYAIYIQDEFLEAFFNENPDALEGTILRTDFKDSTSANMMINMAQKGYRRLFDEEQHNCQICTRD